MMSIEQQIHATRAEQRKQRLIEAERELAAEEAEALHMTEEQRRILMQPFSTVKAEFADLDGLRWTQAALRKLQPPQRRANSHVAATSHATSKPNTYVVLTNADLANFSSEDTIRVSSSSNQSRPSLPSPLSVAKTPLPPTPDPALRHRDGTRSRSPIKGLFPARPVPEPSPANPSHHPIFSEALTPSIKAPSSLRFSVSVPPIGDGPTMTKALAQSLTVSGSGSPSFSRHDGAEASSPSRIVPPGLTPGPPSYSSPTSDPSERSTMCQFPQQPNQDDDLTLRSTRPGNIMKRQMSSDDVGCHFHQGVEPSPSPSPSPMSTSTSPPPSLAPTLSLLCPPSPPTSCGSRLSNTTVTAPTRIGIPHKSARARLHSLLHDDTRLSSPPSPSPAQSPSISTTSTTQTQTQPTFRPITIVPPPLMKVDIIPIPSSSLRLPTLDGSTDYCYDDNDDDDDHDDQTPTPSPVLDYGDQPSTSSPSSAPWNRP